MFPWDLFYLKVFIVKKHLVGRPKNAINSATTLLKKMKFSIKDFSSKCDQTAVFCGCQNSPFQDPSMEICGYQILTFLVNNGFCKIPGK